MKKKQINIFLIFIFCASFLLAQSPAFNFQKFGTEEGLNNANIFSTVQHANGLMYFTTQNGIYFYDGYTFGKLEIDSLKSNALLAISIKNSDELYISIKDEGIANYNLKTKAYHLIPQLKHKNNSDNFIIQDDFAYLLNTGVELTVINIKTGELSPKSDKEKIAYCLFKTRSGRILIGKTDGLYELKNGLESKIELNKKISVHSISETNDGKIVLGTRGQIIYVNNDRIEKEILPVYNTKVTTFLPSGERTIEKIQADGFGRIWFTSIPGDNLYLYQNNTVYDVFELLDIQPSLINSLYKDKDQNIWLGTFSEGAYLIQNSHYNAINFTFNNKILNINSILIKDELIVTGTSNGLYTMNLNNYKSKALSKPDDILTEFIGNLEEINGTIYYSKKNENNLNSAIYSDSKLNYHFKPICASLIYPMDQNKTIIADRFANVLLIDHSNSKLLDTLISFPDYRISVNVIKRIKDSLFIATNNGLFIYDLKTEKYHKVIRTDLNYKINDLIVINDQIFAAHEAGITNITGKKLIQQLGNIRLNSVKKIKVINDQIWLATLDGIYVCNNNWQPLQIINKSSGLPSNSISDISYSGDNICIATNRGIAFTKINHINVLTKPEPVTINYITVNGNAIDYTNGKLNLNAIQEDLQIHFYSPRFNKPNKQYFRYRTDGGDWNNLIENSLQRIIEAGNHKIEISASHDNINWSSSTNIEINKEAKLSESKWLYWIIGLSVFITMTLIGSIIIKRIKNNAKKRLQEEQQVNLLKHQAMNALLSPHFIFNSLTSIQNYINTNNALKASEYLAKFSRLIRMIIEKASQSEITLHDELLRLNYYLELEKERFKNKFDFEIHVDETLDCAELKIPNMIIQPHVENCIIHGILPKLEHGKLNISFKRHNNNKLIIVIEDDGIGLIKAKEHAKTGHKSLGTSTIKNILEINSKLNGKKQNVSMVDKSTLNPPSNGTLITIEIEL